MLLFLTQKVIHKNRQTGKEMHVNLVKCKANLNMPMPHFDERWNTMYDSLKHLENGY